MLPGYEEKLVASQDGTPIGYRRLGAGPALLLVHGGMMAAQSFMKLGMALADSFTVAIPDRRGRGLSEPSGSEYGLQKEVEDVAAVLADVDAHRVFGLSSGAIIALESARQLSTITRLAVYEPPLSIGGSNPAAWLARYDREIAAGDLPAAMVTVSKGVPVSPSFSRLPRVIAPTLMRLAIPAEAKQTPPGDVSLQALIPTMHFDAEVVLDASDAPDRYRALEADVLLLGGGRSPHSLTEALDALDAVLPHARRLEIAGVGHMAADNGGQPDRVAQILRDFFAPHR
ncbi:alpha/beta hydrolase [Microbacterium horticulturae]|uniref:Alpha/beta hydrolase n=1 Tax=Microbacterium horticulturae TaxID=3028316 RepID=A0ABY8BZ96_9MICO|nr:alpha/beta hydrolase [Microbacterium sp. KACC 23027]WEG09484.1 alpha/beta hydrolase [Microbacterium sp. KACC 23027]